MQWWELEARIQLLKLRLESHSLSNGLNKYTMYHTVVQANKFMQLPV